MPGGIIMIINTIKTAVLLAALSGILLALGGFLGGSSGLKIALIISLIMNFITYFFSEKIVLKMYKAQPLDTHRFKDIYAMVQELTTTMNIPMPKLWLVTTEVPNAFATGRNPSHASIAVTTGILAILNEDELRGVLSHELSHIKNRDVLIGTIAATLATAIGYIANMMQHAAFWGTLQGSRSDKKGNNPLVMIIIAVLMPIAAALIQFAISRSREFMADETGAYYSREPLALASALEKLHAGVQQNNFNNQQQDATKTATASLFIVNPFTKVSWSSLFSTHPPVQQRVDRLRKMLNKH